MGFSSPLWNEEGKRRWIHKRSCKTRKSKCRKHDTKEPSDISDEEEENYVRNIKRGRGMYKGKFPFKCFKCCRIGLFY